MPMIESGVVKPPIGATYALEDFGRALVDMDERRTLGKWSCACADPAGWPTCGCRRLGSGA